PSEKGILQARSLAARMSAVKLDKIYSSPTGRALYTAQQVHAHHSCELVTDDRLREISLGRWEGMLESDLREQDGQRYHNFWKDPARYITDGGENFADVGRRMKDFLDETALREEGKTIFVVSHTVAIRMLCSVIKNLPVADLWKDPELKPTSVTRIDISADSAEIISWADSSHLAEL
ncbi:MAG: histidine phosphatase family protein, partial [Spirochaetota bacterium]